VRHDEGSEMAQLELGLSKEQRYTVTRDLTAAAVGERDGGETLDLPAVWSTPDMIAKMEVVSASVVAAHLDTGQMTVGARNEVSHLAATPIGMGVRVRSTLTQVEGRKLTFSVEAFDEKEKVGEGVHVRYIVDRSKFDRRLAEKAKI
jgi:fluoroacetyl-CoA thioesterase